MTSKERVARIFRGQPVDRVVCFEQTIACSVASDILGRRAFTGGSALEYYEACAWWEGEEAHEAFARQVLQDCLELYEALGFDMVRPRLSVLISRPTKRIDEYTFGFADPDDDGEVVMAYDPDAQTWGVSKPPEKKRDLRQQVECMERSLGDLRDEDIEVSLSALDWFVQKVGNEKAVLSKTGSISIPLEEDWLIACASAPVIVERYLECVAETAIRRLPFIKKHGADAIWAGGLIGDIRGPMYGPEVFRKLLLPRLKRIVAKCHELGLPYVYRTDGNIWSIAEELLVHSGIDAYGVSDIHAGMDIGEVRERFPTLVLCGNVSCSSILHLGSVEDVIRETKACIDKARGSGHIVCSSNSIVHGTPADNVIALFETAREYGKV